MITKASGLLSWGRNWLVEQKNLALLISTSTTSERLLRIHLYSSRLILLYSDYFAGRQTVENHLVHTGTYY